MMTTKDWVKLGIIGLCSLVCFPLGMLLLADFILYTGDSLLDYFVERMENV